MGLADNAQRAIETAGTQEARRVALSKLLESYGPRAIDDYVKRPLTAYYESINKPLIQKFFDEYKGRIPKGLEMYRAPSMGEVQTRLPREVGATYRPGVVTSFGAASDLQNIGDLFTRGSNLLTGGNQSYAPGVAKITAMTDLPGIVDINEFLQKYGYNTRSAWNAEGLIGPKVRYKVQSFNPGGNGAPASWNLGAYANMGLGAANILGFLPMLIEAGKIATGKSDQFKRLGEMK